MQFDNARVISAHGDYYRVSCSEGTGLARKKASAYHRNPDMPQPVTGDYVRLEWNSSGESRILETLPRTSSLERIDPSSHGYRAQTIAANFDSLFFLMSVNENFSIPRLERFLAMAETSSCLPLSIIVLTKTDLVKTQALLDTLIAKTKESAGNVPVIAISSKDGIGLDKLSPYVQPGKTIALVGSSGVGKSSLVNALAGEFVMDTCEIQEWSGKGRHTTTVRELVTLPSGAMVIDTPGMRELGVIGEDRRRFISSGTHRYR